MAILRREKPNRLSKTKRERKTREPVTDRGMVNLAKNPLLRNRMPIPASAEEKRAWLPSAKQCSKHLPSLNLRLCRFLLLTSPLMFKLSLPSTRAFTILPRRRRKNKRRLPPRLNFRLNLRLNLKRGSINPCWIQLYLVSDPLAPLSQEHSHHLQLSRLLLGCRPLPRSLVLRRRISIRCRFLPRCMYPFLRTPLYLISTRLHQGSSPDPSLLGRQAATDAILSRSSPNLDPR